jgi:hypothetical protein
MTHNRLNRRIRESIIRGFTMKLSIVLSTHDAQFQAVAFKGDFESNIVKIAGWGYDGVELAIRDPKLVDVEQLKSVVSAMSRWLPASAPSSLLV